MTDDLSLTPDSDTPPDEAQESPAATPEALETASSAQGSGGPLQSAQMQGNEPIASSAQTTQAAPTNNWRELLTRAVDAIQGRTRKRLDKILAEFDKKKTLTNDDVEKLLHVSDATATRYLYELVKEGKIKRTGKTKSAAYTKS